MSRRSSSTQASGKKAAPSRLLRLSLRKGFRILSSYPVCECAVDSCDEHRVWIITEADRSATMILLPEDY